MISHRKSISSGSIFAEIKTLVERVCTSDRGYHPLQVANAREVRELLRSGTNKNNFLFKTSYKKTQEVVVHGEIVEQMLPKGAQLHYAHVPLGFIVSGKVTVIKGNKGLKELSEGDFFGLFETANFLLTAKRKQIGDWTLLAETDVTILYFGASVFEEEAAGAKKFKRYLIELARADHVPQPISTLPLLDWVAGHVTKERPSDCAIIAHTHLLPNNLPLFRHLSSLLDFGQIYVLEKPYSTVPKALRELVWSGFEVIPVHMESNFPYEFAVGRSLDVLWRKVIDDQKKRNFKKLLIVDDGGDVSRSIPWSELEGVQIAVVEQTQRGIARIEGSKLKFPPVVSVASSGVKKIVESDFIGTSVVKKLKDLGALDGSRQVGIIGMGSVGQAVEKSLHKIGISALFYDSTHHQKAFQAPLARASLDVLLNECDLIIGTTGTDALKGLPFERVISGKKVLASASSADVEFASLLKLALPHSDPFGTFTVPVHEKLTIEILNGGYPINFDRQKDTTPDEDIVLTRCLMYIGAMQALELIDEGVSDFALYNLDKISQTKLLTQWIKEKRLANGDLSVAEKDVSGIVNFTSLQGGKEMTSVWQE